MDENTKDQLQTDLLFINNELQAEQQKGAEGDSGKIALLEQRKADVQNQLDGINKAEKEQQIEDKVHSEITFAIPGVDFTQLPVELITIIHAVVKADRRKNLSEHSAELEKVEGERDEWSDMYKSSKVEFDLLQEKLKECEKVGIERGQEIDKLKTELFELNNQVADVQRNRDNAATQLEEAKAEIERLKSEVDDYQKAKVLGERQAQAVIDVTANEADEINAAINLFVKSENWGSVEKLYLPDGTFKVVKRDELVDWTAITPPPLLGGGETASETFQGEASEVIVADSGIPATEISVTPSEEEGILPAITLPGTVAEQKDEVIRRLERLEIAVFGQGRVA